MTGIIALNKLKRQHDLEIVRELLKQMFERGKEPEIIKDVDNAAHMTKRDFTFATMNELFVSKRTAQEYIDSSLAFLKLKFKESGGVEQ